MFFILSISIYSLLNYYDLLDHPLDTTPKPSPTPIQATFEQQGPGSFNLTSPSNKMYRSNAIILEVTGFLFEGQNVDLSMTYNLDGKEQYPLSVSIERPTDYFTFIAEVYGVVTLTQLSDGHHNITVFGDFQHYDVLYRHQATVSFIVNQKYV